MNRKITVVMTVWCLACARLCGADAGVHTGGITEITSPGKLGQLMTTAPITGFLPSFDTNKIPNANPVGAGARAAGMGSAFIAVADDATAASWNPGGLVQLERPEFSVVYHYIDSGRDIHSNDYPLVNEPNQITDGDINYLSAALPFTFKGHNMVTSINFQRCYDFNKVVDYQYHDFSRTASPTVAGRTTTHDEYYNVEYEQAGYLNTVTPAFALELTPDLSIGAAVNFWGSGVPDSGYGDKQQSTRSEERYVLDGNYVDRTYVNEESSIATDTEITSGTNVNLGMLWRTTPKLTLGAVLKTPFTADLSTRERTTLDGSLYQGRLLPNSGTTLNPTGANDWSQWRVANETVTPYSYSSEETYHDQLHFPLIWGVGASWRFNDAFTVAASWTRTYWENFTIKYDSWEERVDLSAEEESFVAGKNITPGDTIRLGFEYLIIKEKTIIPLRGGVFLDPEPGEEGLDDYYGITVGTGYAFGSRAVFDCAYQYRWSTDAGTALNVPDGTEEAKQHKVVASIIYYF